MTTFPSFILTLKPPSPYPSTPIPFLPQHFPHSSSLLLTINPSPLFTPAHPHPSSLPPTYHVYRFLISPHIRHLNSFPLFQTHPESHQPFKTNSLHSPSHPPWQSPYCLLLHFFNIRWTHCLTAYSKLHLSRLSIINHLCDLPLLSHHPRLSIFILTTTTKPLTPSD